MILLFKVTKSHQEAMRKVRTIVCCSKYYQNDFHYEAKAPWREGSPMIILLCNLLRWNLSKCSQFVKLVLPIIKKSEKREVKKAVSSLFAILCYLPLSQIWSYELFLSTGAREGTNMFNGPTNLWKFHLWKRDKSCPKDPYFVCRKTLWNWKELR